MSLPSALPDLYDTLHTRAPGCQDVTSPVAGRARRRGTPVGADGAAGPWLSEADREIAVRIRERDVVDVIPSARSVQRSPAQSAEPP